MVQVEEGTQYAHRSQGENKTWSQKLPRVVLLLVIVLRRKFSQTVSTAASCRTDRTARMRRPHQIYRHCRHL